MHALYIDDLSEAEAINLKSSWLKIHLKDLTLSIIMKERNTFYLQAPYKINWQK